MKALILTYEKFQDHEVIYPYYALKGEGFKVNVCSNLKGCRVDGILGAHIYSDLNFNDLVEKEADGIVYKVYDFDLLIIPGGVKALEKLRLQPKAVGFVKLWMQQNKPTFSICNGAQLLITADALKGRKASGYYSIEPDIINAGAEYSRDEVVIDGNLVCTPHYDFMGQWVKQGLTHFNENFWSKNDNSKTLGS